MSRLSSRYGTRDMDTLADLHKALLREIQMEGATTGLLDMLQGLEWATEFDDVRELVDKDAGCLDG